MAENAHSTGVRSFSIHELAALVSGRVVTPATGPMVGQDSATLQISGLAALGDATASDLSHLSSLAYLPALQKTAAGAVLLSEAQLPNCPALAIVVDRPYWAYARLSALFETPQQIAGVSGTVSIASSAAVDTSAMLGEGVRIGAGATVGASAQLSRGVVVHANAVVGAGVKLGENVTIHAGAVVCDDAEIGADSTVHANAVIGSEGFGYAPDSRGVLARIAQLGRVVLGKNVSVGAGSTIDRGALGDTCIGDGVKIDNQVQIGHNCLIGDHSVICGCCGIVGSTTIGAHCVLGGGVGIGGDRPITLCDGVTVSGMTHVSRSIDTPGVYSGGVLHAESRRWKRNALRFADLDSIAKRLASLEKRFRK